MFGGFGYAHTQGVVDVAAAFWRFGVCVEVLRFEVVRFAALAPFNLLR